MADANARKDLSIFSNELKLERLVYDFAKDGGAVGDLDIGTASHNMVVVQAIVVVQAACTSAGSATVVIGAAAADPDGRAPPGLRDRSSYARRTPGGALRTRVPVWSSPPVEGPEGPRRD